MLIYRTQFQGLNPDIESQEVILTYEMQYFKGRNIPEKKIREV